MKIELESRQDGKPSLTLAEHGQHIIRIPDSSATPYKADSHRDRAWCVVRLMDGITVQEGNDILKTLECGIQGRDGQPLGWIRDAVEREYAEVYSP